MAEYSPWWLLVAALGALAAAGWLYFYRSPFGKWPSRTLALLRFLWLFGLAALLLNWMLQWRTQEKEKPLLLLLEDQSASLSASPDSAQIWDWYRRQWPDMQASLRNTYRLERIPFAEAIRADTATLLRGKRTNISQVIEHSLTAYENRNVGGAVLMSDGLFNLGYNPTYRGAELPFPLYTLGLGDTALRRDAAIKRVVHNDIAYPQSSFPVEIHLEAQRLAGKSLNVNLSRADGSLVLRERVELEDNRTFTKIKTRITAAETGLLRYRVQIDPLEGEANRLNNEQYFTVEVLNNRKEIHLLSRTIHPDVAALKRALQQQKSYRVRSFLESNYPLDSLSRADMVVLFSPQAATARAVQKARKPYWLLAGINTEPTALTALGVNYPEGFGDFEKVQPQYNAAFSRFNISPAQARFLKDLPPVESSFGDVTLRGNEGILLHKKIGAVSTNYPLMGVGISDQKARLALFNGEGLWRWRVYNYQQHQHFRYFDRLVRQTAQYLLAGQGRERLEVDYEPQYPVGQPVSLRAVLYDAALQPTTQGKIKLQLVNERGESLDFEFTRAEEFYQSELSNLAAGVYQFRAEATLGSEVFLRQGAFEVKTNTLERARTRADFNLLRQMAKATNGQFFTQEQGEDLRTALLQNEKARVHIHSTFQNHSVLDYLFYVLLLILLAGAEWALRKYWGHY